MSNSIKETICGYLSVAIDRKIVIYGMGKVGEELYDELKMESPCV